MLMFEPFASVQGNHAADLRTPQQQAHSGLVLGNCITEGEANWSTNADAAVRSPPAQLLSRTSPRLV